MTSSISAAIGRLPADAFVKHPLRSQLIEHVLRRREALVTRTGALATWGAHDCTGRIPEDTYVVRDAVSEGMIDWNSPNSHAMTRETFDLLLADAVSFLEEKDRLYLLERSGGSEERCALPLRIITSSPLAALFADTMFPPRSAAHSSMSVLPEPFTLLILPHDRLSGEKYRGRLREDDGRVTDQVIVMDITRRTGIILGTTYLGAIKKTVFTVLNVLLPEHGILPLHCAAARDERGEMHLFLGLSGTGKTTLSADPALTLIGDDEHLWSGHGIANMEGGCYAKLAGLSPQTEPQIHEAIFTPRTVLESGVIIENALVFPTGEVDLSDTRLTENSRASYPLSFLQRSSHPPKGNHPSTILFLTADASGVLPPVARLTLPQALLWFLMGYTSKVAGTEAGITVPKCTFSRFFGAPFMLRSPGDYLSSFQEYASLHRSRIFLVNTGWSGGPFGSGKRMGIGLSRAVVSAVISGALDTVLHTADSRFHFSVPASCPGVDPSFLHPRRTWSDPEAYERAADALANAFAAHFEKHFVGIVPEEVAAECPGRSR